MIQKLRKLSALFGRSEGLAQIPIMIGLLLMAIAVPAVTRLAQQNQDIRNRAAGGTSNPATPTPACKVGSAADYCAYGRQYRCVNGKYTDIGSCALGTATKVPTKPPIGCTGTGEGVCPAGTSCDNLTHTCKANTSTCTTVGQKLCDGTTNLKTCVQLSTGQKVWSSALCVYGCLNNACKPAPTPTLDPNANCSIGTCVNGKLCVSQIVNGQYVGRPVGGPCGTPTPVICGTAGSCPAGSHCGTGNICIPNLTPTSTGSGCNIMSGSNGEPGETRCMADGLYRCSNNAWTKVQNCDYGCKVNSGGPSSGGNDACNPGPLPTGPTTNCSQIKDAVTCAYTPSCQWNNGACVKLGTSPFPTSTNCAVGDKKCQNGSLMTCTRLSNGSLYWQGTSCQYGCTGIACNKAPTLTPAPTVPVGCVCVNGIMKGTTCSDAVVGKPCPTIAPASPTPTPTIKPVCNPACVTGWTCVYDASGKPICVVEGQVNCKIGETMHQSSLLGCPAGTKRVCKCLSPFNWSCFCDTDGDGTDTCRDHLNGATYIKPDGTKGWLHFNDEASAICMCGPGKYCQNDNGKYLCGVDHCDRTNPTAKPTGPSPTKAPTVTPGGQCTGSKPADICTASKLSVNAACVNGKWDYDEQLCNVKGRESVCGGKPYCCPAVNGSWTTNMTVCNSLSKCTQCPSTFSCYKSGSEYRWFAPGFVQQGFTAVANATTAAQCGGVAKPTFLGKAKGDANCDGIIDTADYSLWHKEFYEGDLGAVNKKTWNADFTGPNGVCDGVVDTADYSLWHKYFYELLKLL